MTGQGPGARGTRAGWDAAERICEAASDTRDAADMLDKTAGAYRSLARDGGRLARRWADWCDGKARALETAAVHARRMFNAAESF